MAWLLPRDSPLKRRFTVIDAVLTRALAPLRDAVRARAEKCLLLARADGKLHVADVR